VCKLGWWETTVNVLRSDARIRMSSTFQRHLARGDSGVMRAHLLEPHTTIFACDGSAIYPDRRLCRGIMSPATAHEDCAGHARSLDQPPISDIIFSALSSVWVSLFCERLFLTNDLVHFYYLILDKETALCRPASVRTLFEYAGRWYVLSILYITPDGITFHITTFALARGRPSITLLSNHACDTHQPRP